MEFLFRSFSSNPCILCANPYINDIELWIINGKLFKNNQCLALVEFLQLNKSSSLQTPKQPIDIIFTFVTQSN